MFYTLSGYILIVIVPQTHAGLAEGVQMTFSAGLSVEDAQTSLMLSTTYMEF